MRRAAPTHPGISPTARRWLAVGAVLLSLVVIGLAFAIIGGSVGEVFEEPEETLEILSRLAALLAVSFILLDMLTGSFRPLLTRRFKPARLQSVHTAFGLTGFSLALAHFLLLLPSLGGEWEELNQAFFLLGPVALGLVGVTILTALKPTWWRNSWRKLHLLNYLVFTIAVIHGLAIGEDGTRLATRLIFGSYLALAFAGLLYRIWLTLAERRRDG